MEAVIWEYLKDELSKLLADTFFEFGSSGKVLYKDEDISEMTLGEVRMTLSNFEIHPLSEEIVLTTYRVYNEVNEKYCREYKKICRDSYAFVF
mgnify:CR=1 FL=1